MGLEGAKSGAFILRFFEVRGEAGGGAAAGNRFAAGRRGPHTLLHSVDWCRVVTGRPWAALKVPIRSAAEPRRRRHRQWRRPAAAGLHCPPALRTANAAALSLTPSAAYHLHRGV